MKAEGILEVFAYFYAEENTFFMSVMNFEILNFVTFCVGNLSDALQMSAGQVYQILRSSGILSGYIIPNYDVLHTFSKEYIVEDLITCMKEKGALA